MKQEKGNQAKFDRESSQKERRTNCDEEARNDREKFSHRQTYRAKAKGI